MGLGQLSLLLTWSFIEITMLIIIPLLRFNHLLSPQKNCFLLDYARHIFMALYYAIETYYITGVIYIASYPKHTF